MDRNLYLNSRKVSFINFADVMAQKAARKNKIKYNDDNSLRNSNDFFKSDLEKMTLSNKKRGKSLHTTNSTSNELGNRNESLNLLDESAE